MTDKEILLKSRLKEAEETLQDALNMLSGSFSTRSIINRAYYSMFYMLLALFIKFDLNVKTSKHSGIISLFDREFVKKSIVDQKYSKILHRLFDARQEGDYKELKNFTIEDAEKYVEGASDFINNLKKIIE